MGRPRQDVHLSAGIVDVVLARHAEAGLGQQSRERIANHGTPAVSDMHRSGGVGRHELDIDALAAADP